MVNVTGNNDISRMLHTRLLQGICFKQTILCGSRVFPAGCYKRIQNLLWRNSLRHMRYVMPEVRFQPLENGAWEILRRDIRSFKKVSIPLVVLQKSVLRPSVIIATGPSALEYDWATLINNEKTIFAVNGASSMLEKYGLKSDFLVVSDHRFGREGASHITLAVDQGAKLLLTHEAAASFAMVRPDVLARAELYLFEKVDRWYGLPTLGAARLTTANINSGCPFVLPTEPTTGVGWSRDPMMGVFAGKTVPFAALQLIVWMGSPSIEIVGMDLGGIGHAYHEDHPTVSHLQKDYHQYILPSFGCMAAALSTSTQRIYNLSPTCPLPKMFFSKKKLSS